MSRILEYGDSPDTNAFNALNPICDGAVIMIDDGTLDTVFTCSRCHRMFRYTFDSARIAGSLSEGMSEYNDFVDWALDDAIASHEDGI